MKKLFFCAAGLICAAALAVTLSVNPFAPQAGSLLSINIEALAQDEDNSSIKYLLKDSGRTCTAKNDDTKEEFTGKWYDCKEDSSGSSPCYNKCKES